MSFCIGTDQLLYRTVYTITGMPLFDSLLYSIAVYDENMNLIPYESLY